MRMPWLPSLNTGVCGFDDDHRHLLEVLGEIRISLVAGNLSGVRALFVELYCATHQHFGQEEALMERHAYPTAAAHRAEHDHCRAALRRLQAQLDDRKLDHFGEALADYTADYFRGVIRFDAQLAHFLRETRALSATA